MTEPFDVVVPQPVWPLLTADTAALVLIDLQYLDAHRAYGLGAQARERGSEGELAYRFERIDRMLPSVRRLIDGCRDVGVQAIYVRIATHRADGRDGSPSLRGLHCHPDSKEAQILEPIAPRAGDIVLDKSSISAFTTSSIDSVLRNLGVRTIIAAGVVTNGCVELTMRDAADRGYFAILVEDCCGANSERLHREALERMDRGFLRVSTSEHVLTELRQNTSATAIAVTA